MIKVHNDIATGLRIKPCKIIQELADYGSSLDLLGKVLGEVRLVDVDFYSTAASHAIGPSGYCGNTGIIGPIAHPARGELETIMRPDGVLYTRISPNAPPVIVVDNTQYVLSLDCDLLHNPVGIAELFTGKTLTHGSRGTTLTPLRVTPCNTTANTRYMVIPLPGAYETLEVLQKHDPDATIRRVITCRARAEGRERYSAPLTKHVVSPHQSLTEDDEDVTDLEADLGAVDVYREKTSQKPSHYHVRFEMLVCDVELHIIYVRALLAILSEKTLL